MEHAPTAEVLAEQLWDILNRPTVVRQIAIRAVEQVLTILKTDEEIDARSGRGVQGRQPS